MAARFMRAFLLGAALGAVGSLAIYSAVKISDPVLLLHHQRKELAALKAKSQRLARQKQRLEARLKYFASQDGLTQRMHELGRLRPGERFVRLLPSEQPAQTTDGESPDQPTDRIRSAAKSLGKRVKQSVVPRPQPE